MLIPKKTANETSRLKALRELEILDTPNEVQYDQLTSLAAKICGTQLSLISLIDEDRQWFKSSFGADLCETDRDVSICGHAILQSETLVVPDIQNDVRFFDNPVLQELGIRFYAGVPLINKDGHVLGTLCVLDNMPMDITEEQLDILQILANHVALLLNKRRIIIELSTYQKALESYQEKFQEEQQIMRDLMVRMIRSDSLSDPALCYWSQAAEDMGGDLIAATYSPYQKYYVMLADSAGHGLASAINLIPISEAFYTMASKGLPVDMIVDSMNRKIHELSPVNRFVAAVVLCLDPSNQTVEIWNGGMPPVYLTTEHGEIERRFDSTNLALGILDIAQPPHTELYQWKNAQHLFAYSDGLSEASDHHGSRFGRQNIENLITNRNQLDVFKNIQSSVQEHLKDSHQHDDISLMAVSIDSLNTQNRASLRNLSSVAESSSDEIHNGRTLGSLL